MIRSRVRSAGLAVLLTMNGCGPFLSSDTGARSPGLNVAEAALQGGSGQVALQVSEGVLRASPGDTHALAIKGDALSLLGDYTNAEAIFLTLLAKDPASIRANTGLGRIKLTKDPAAAEALFQLVLKRDPKDLTALNNLGIARDLQGRHAEAQPAYRQALAVNPDLDSAQVNLALSMAMSGQGAAAVQLLQAKATQPGASTKVKHDYAAVLAMSGRRTEAERVLSESLAPDEIRHALDSVTGNRTKVAHETSPESGSGRRVAGRTRDDGMEPDVVQVPEMPAPVTRVARASAPVMAAATPPMVVRPAPSPEADAPVIQPVNPIAAAVTNQRALALPAQSAQMLGHAALMEAAQEPEIATPKVVAMPLAPRTVPAPMRMASADVARVALPDAPPPPPILAPVPLPSSYKPLPVARGESQDPRPVAKTPDPLPVHAPMPTAQPVQIAPPRGGPALTPNAESAATVMAGRATTESSREMTAVRSARRGDTDAMVQFAASASEESAHAFWQSLVQRFPGMLGQREPAIIRVEKGGMVFWRVRAEGFDTVADAQSLCARVRAGGQDCFVPRS